RAVRQADSASAGDGHRDVDVVDVEAVGRAVVVEAVPGADVRTGSKASDGHRACDPPGVVADAVARVPDRRNRPDVAGVGRPGVVDTPSIEVLRLGGKRGL